MINWFKKKSEETKMREDWENLVSEEQLDEIALSSHQKIQVLFKHSTRCYISSKALTELKKNLQKSDDLFDFYFLDLLVYRNISNAISERFGVEHQSPQVILIKNNKAFYNESHSSIKADDLVRIIKSSQDE